MTAATLVHKFRGTLDQKIDAKGRLSVPSVFRKVIEQGDPDFVPARSRDEPGTPAALTLVSGDAGMNHFECYSVEGMRRIDALIDAMDEDDPKRELAEYFYYSQSHTLQIDSDGRIILPQRLRDKLGLEGEVLFVGMGNHFQMWKPATHEAEQAPMVAAVRAEHGAGFRPRRLISGARGATAPGGERA